MADREATIRLNLSAAGFQTSLRELQKQSKAFAEALEDISGEGKKISFMVKSLEDGGKAVAKSFHTMAGDIKNGLKAALTLGGALSFQGAAKGAIELQSAYQDIAFAVRRSTGAAHQWQDVQKRIEGTAGRWKIANGEVADSFAEIFQTTEDLEFTTKATESAARVSRATGASLQAMTGIASDLGTQFGVTGNEIDAAMALVVGTVPGGKKGLEEFGDKFRSLGASARSAGLEGKAGLEQVVGMLNVAGARGADFEEKLQGVTQLMETLGDPEKAKALEKQLGVKPGDKRAALGGNALERIIIATGGNQEKLSKVFSGPMQGVAGQLGQTYQKVFTETEGNEMEKTEQALSAFRDAILVASKSSIDAAAIEAQANSRLDDPQAQLVAALNELEKAFATPKMIEAIKKLAEVAPEAVNALAKLVEFAVDNPVLAGTLAGAGYVGVRTGGALLGSVGESATDRLGEKFGSWLGKAGPSVGDKIAQSAGPLAAGFAKIAGPAIGILVASYLAYEHGKKAIDKSLDKHFDGQESLADARHTAEVAARDGTPAQKEAAAKTLREAIDREKKNAPDFLTEGIGVVANYIDPSVKTASDRHATGIAKAEFELKQLEQTMQRPADALSQVAEKQLVAAKALESAARSLGGEGGSRGAGNSGTNGLPPSPPNGNGSMQ